jgi:hypothetical protein
MRWLYTAFLWIAFGISVAMAGESGATGELENVDSGLPYDQAESEKLIVDLFERNQELVAENEALRANVESLQRSLAESRVLLDLKGGAPAATVEPVGNSTVGAASVDANQLKILEVNREMMAAVISGGLRAGMKVGMKFSVVRDNETLAVVRLIEVRDNIAGGLIEKVEKNRFPIAGDRLVLRKTQD